MKTSTKNKICRVFIIVGLLIGLIYALFPVIWMISCAFKSNTEVFTVPQRIIPRKITFEAFTSVFTDATKLRSAECKPHRRKVLRHTELAAMLPAAVPYVDAPATLLAPDTGFH